MADTYWKLVYHLVWSTRSRQPVIGQPWREELHAYFGGIAREMGSTLMRVGGTSDHVHLLVCVPPRLALADLVRSLKTGTTHWINGRGLVQGKFAWQAGYGAFTVSHSNIEAVTRYLEAQEAHHRRRTSREEIVELLDRHPVPRRDEYLD